MKIACFFPSNIFCSWNFSEGIPATLRRMGHEVEENEEHYQPHPDLVLVSGPEHQPIQPWEGRDDAPVAYWFHETCDRADHDFAPQYEQLVKEADLNYFIRKADAGRFGGKWLPFGVDETIFNIGLPFDPIKPQFEYLFSERPHKIAFVGQLYDSRRRFLEEYKRLGGPEIEILQFVGEGKSPEERARELAESHRNTQIFVVLPTLIRTTPCKVFEAAACGCCVVAPTLSLDTYGPREFVPYPEQSPHQLRSAIALLEMMENKRRDVAAAGYRATHRYFTLEKSLQQIIDDVKGL